MSKIEWTEVTWNPVTGCTKVSAGCKNCYAEKQAHRNMAMQAALRASGKSQADSYRNGFKLTLQPERLRVLW